MSTLLSAPWNVATAIACNTARKCKADKRDINDISAIIAKSIPEMKCNERQRRLVRLWYLRSMEGSN